MRSCNRFLSPVGFALLFLASSASAQEQAPTVLHVETREAVLDVVARDAHNKPVTDLSVEELEVTEIAAHGAKSPQRILALRTIDPHRDESSAGSNENGFHLSSGAICALNAATHYELAIPASHDPGYHQVLIKTTRPHVTLSFRHRYYVGQKPTEADSAPPKSQSDTIAFAEAACFHPLVPPTLAVRGRALLVPGAKATRYAAIVRPESLAAIGLDGENNRVQLDFGMCIFDSTGGIVQYLHSSIDRQLNAEELDRAHARGLINVLEVPGVDPPYLVRLVLGDRLTGNLGIVDISRPVTLAAQADPKQSLPRPVGSIRSFGVVTPHENAFCGDVYELSSGASELPNFWNLDPVGSLYTDTLNVLQQDITNAEGIPGVTRNNTWFGIDYYGEFYIDKPGEYAFELESDDGSRLEIDDQEIINLDGVHQSQAKTGHVQLAVGRHTIHVPYFQGPPTSLALILGIKPPGESMRPFKLSSFAH